MDDAQARAVVGGWKQTIDAIHTPLTAAPPPPPPSEGMLGQVGDWAGNALHSVEQTAADGVNGVLSFGNALLHNPLAGVELAGGVAAGAVGLAATVTGAVVQVPSVAADVTVVGAPLGALGNAAGAGLMAGGAASVYAGEQLTSDALSQLNEAAHGTDQVSPMQVDWKTKGGDAGQARQQQQSEDAQRAAGQAHAEYERTGKIPKDTPGARIGSLTPSGSENKRKGRW